MRRTLNTILGALFCSFVAVSPALAQCTTAPSIPNRPNYSAANSAYTIPCSASTANLAAVTASTVPSGAIQTWHTGTPATKANRINPTSSVGGGTQFVYSAFYHEGNDCFSPTKAITIYAPICAVDDDYSATVVMQGVPTTLPSLYINDTYNGTSFTGPNPNINFLYEWWELPIATVNPDGTINVLPTAPVGTYTFFYKIEDNDADAVSGSNSSVAMVTIVIGTPLPVSLAKFEIAKTNNGVALDWSTATEQNNRGFDVERSTDGIDWQSIAFVNSKANKGNSTELIGYQYIDVVPNKGTNMYRLKQIDVDGKNSTSVVKSINITSLISVDIYPNPAHDNITISGLGIGGVVKIYNFAGQLTKQLTTSADQQQISISELVNGVYYVHVINEMGKVQVTKIAKMN